MRHLGTLIVLVIGGCNRSVETAPMAAEAPAVAPVAGVPHAGNIREVATTPAGDAVISLDDLGGLRVWPALDGTREPIAISVAAPAHVALAPDGGDLLAAVLDQSGSAQVLRVSRDGRVTSRAQAAGDIPIVQIVGEGDGILALRADQTIDRIDASGAVRAHLASDPGERIATIIARNGRAAAVLEDGRTLRWIERGAWGARVTLPASLRPDTVALAPDHRRLAAGEATSGQLFVYDLDVAPAVVLATGIELADHERVGFTDDDHVVALASLRWWSPGTPRDPWAATTQVTGGMGAVANGRAIVGSGAALALVTQWGTRYLGWADVGVRDASFVGDHVALSTSPAHWLWLDDRLVARGSLEVDTDVGYGQVIDDHRVVIAHEAPKGRSEVLVEVIDTQRAQDKVTLGRFAAVQQFDYDPATRVFAIVQSGVLHRWRIDATVTALPDVTLHRDYRDLRIADAGDLVARGTFLVNGGMRVEGVRADGSTQVMRRVPGGVVAIDRDGAIYARAGDDIVVYRGDVETTLPAAQNAMPSHAGDLAATFGTAGLALYDRAGTERWRLPLSNVTAVAFGPDDRELYVRTLGGILVLDTLTGESRATACGWQFGLSERAPDLAPAGTRSVCEDNA